MRGPLLDGYRADIWGPEEPGVNPECVNDDGSTKSKEDYRHKELMVVLGRIAEALEGVERKIVPPAPKVVYSYIDDEGEEL